MFMFGEKLKLLRKQNSLTQEQLAAALGVDRTSITKYERSDAVPPLSISKRICEYFAVTLDYMLDIESTGKPESAYNKTVILFQRAAEQNNLTPAQLKDIFDYAKYRYPDKFAGIEFDDT